MRLPGGGGDERPQPDDGVFLLPESRKPRARAAEKMRLNPFSSLRRLHGKPGLLPLAGIYLIMALVSQAPATLWIYTVRIVSAGA
jgi:hypothetical protein